MFSLPLTRGSAQEKSLYDIGNQYGTDKVTYHRYHNLYDKYLPSIRHKKIKMLEIGLGCDMVRVEMDRNDLSR